MSARGLSILLGICVAVGLIVAAGILYLRSIDFSAYRSVIVSRLERITGREVRIEGGLDVSLSLTPTLIAENVTLANADWGSRPTMARAERIELEIQLLPLLLDGDIRVDRLVIARADVLLEMDAEENGNWEFHRGRPPEPAEGPFDPGRFLLEDVTIVDARVTWRGGSAPADPAEEIRIDRFVWQANDVTSRLTLSGEGAYRSLPVEIMGSVGSLANLLRESNPYPVDLRVTTAADIAATIEGQLGADPEGGDFALAMDAAGADIAPLGKLAGVPLPSFGPFEAHIELINREERLAARDIRITAGDPEATRIRVRGSVAAVTAGEGVDLRLSAEGEDLGRLAALAGIEIAPFGPYTIETRLTDADGGDLVLTDLEAAAGDEMTHLTAVGTIRRPLEGAGLDLTVSAEGSSLEGLSPLFGTDLPPLGPYRLGGRLTDPAETAYRLAEMEARFGPSRFGGQALLKLPAGERPRIEAALRAELLDFNAMLDGAWSSAPAERTVDSDRLFGDEEIELNALRAVDADLELRAAKVALGRATMEDVGLELELDGGRLAIEPLAFRIAGGQASAQLLLDAGTPPPAAEIRLEVTDLDVGTAMERIANIENLSGRASLDLGLRSTDQSLHALMTHLDGRVALVVPRGRIVGTELHRLVADLDVLKLLPPFRGRQQDEGIDINCLVGQSVVEEGRAAIELLLDTDRMTLATGGTVDLGAETIDLHLVPKPKSSKLSAVAVPVDIEGSLADPAVRPRTDVAIGQGVAGLVGGLLLPLNLFAGLVGDGAEKVCPETVVEATKAPPAAGRAAPDETEPDTAESLPRRRR